MKALTEDLEQKKIRPESIRSLGGGSNDVERNQYPKKAYQIKEINKTENHFMPADSADHGDRCDRSDRNDRDGDRGINSGTGQADHDGSGGGEK